MIVKKLTAFLFIACLLASFTASAHAQQTPMERVREGADKLTKILSNPKMQDPAHHDETIAQLRETAEQYIDFRLTTMYSIGKPWLSMSEQLQKDLTEAFIQLLERSYLKRIPVYDGQKVDYQKELVSGKKAKVYTQIIDKDKAIVVEFRLRDNGTDWMIYDVVAEGVSLVSNYRTQFTEILTNNSPEELLQIIRDRIAKIDKGEVVPDDDKLKE